ncbi:MAG: DNA mismatch repair protein MutS [Gammaproteobacteria bacterium]|nr:DNA mismatch repair protein MutS [Gammaproteobacteria bacterium]
MRMTATLALRTMSRIMGRDKKTDNDGELFRHMMSEVKPLPDNKSGQRRITTQKPHPAPKRRPPAPDTPSSAGFVAREHAPAVAPEENLFFAHSGPQRRLLRQLKRGEIRPEASLDLHGQTLAEAGTLLAHFLEEAQNAGLRCLCVVHGKGHRSAAGRPVLKTQVNQWLRDTSAVLAFCSAQPKDGGMGAVYVLLKRNQ